MTTESTARPGRIDTDALRRRYAEERDKRLRPDGYDQYLRLTGEFARYLDDPHTPWTERVPRTDHRTVVCVGGGFAGLVTGTRLREAGVDVRIIEKGGDFGGTWYWNRYPGAQCDTASMVYLWHRAHDRQLTNRPVADRPSAGRRRRLAISRRPARSGVG